MKRTKKDRPCAFCKHKTECKRTSVAEIRFCNWCGAIDVEKFGRKRVERFKSSNS